MFKTASNSYFDFIKVICQPNYLDLAELIDLMNYIMEKFDLNKLPILLYFKTLYP